MDWIDPLLVVFEELGPAFDLAPQYLRIGIFVKNYRSEKSLVELGEGAVSELACMNRKNSFYWPIQVLEMFLSHNDLVVELYPLDVLIRVHLDRNEVCFLRLFDAGQVNFATIISVIFVEFVVPVQSYFDCLNFMVHLGGVNFPQ